MITFTNIFQEKYNIQNHPYFFKIISQTIENEGYKEGEILFIFTSDEYLLQINRRYLTHDTYTDIITFSESDNTEIISGEIFISLDRVLDNAKKFEVSPTKELARVLVHGILHLVGYNDKTVKEKKIMRTKEDYYINLQPNSFGQLFHVKHI